MKTIENKIGTQEEQSLVMKEMHDLASNIKYGKVINCQDCFGRGYSGWDTKLQQYIPCNCIMTVANKIRLNKFKENLKERTN
uniref:Uncharacterized protein n=1 Tax=viral metagenome TaxID=1070528 RepID=A0A6H1ZQR3_9ZZZZ